MIMIEILFWLFIFLIFYAYLGYPLLLALLAVFLRKPVEKSDITPSVSLLISAYNEEKVIKQKIENSLSLDYPKEKLEIVVISDASTDRTNEIAGAYCSPRRICLRYDNTPLSQDGGVKLLVQPERMGKTAGLNQAVPMATGEIIVFTDANAMFRKDALRKLVRPFADKSIGFVSGVTEYISKGNTGINEGMGIYSKLELFIKTKESRIGSVVGADGAIFAIRKNLYEHLHSDHINDFIIPIQIAKKGFRGIQEDEAVCLEESASSSKGEFKRQTRIINRCIKGLVSEWTILSPFKWKLFALELFSHKVLKWLVPFLMVSVFFLNLLLMFHGIIYNIIFLCQLSFYLFVAVEILVEKNNVRVHLFSLPYQFCFLNYAILKGWISFIRGNVDTVWTPERG
ncbi:MAG TPA: glycosyltransferase family 2 protein [Candidatus Brocadiia bacterium]|nr:glycosyltransferase family 2 protein [Planctomycetota bacterium]MDO8092496.1 glycosyltransferase family 2 protein [Candidatus Brocadiales bacterium]